MFEDNKKTVLGVNILGKEYKIGCEENLESSLLEAAKYLDQKMRQIRDQYHVIGSDKIAVLSALHITHELLNNKSSNTKNNNELQQKLELLNQKIPNTISS